MIFRELLKITPIILGGKVTAVTTATVTADAFESDNIPYTSEEYYSFNGASDSKTDEFVYSPEKTCAQESEKLFGIAFTIIIGEDSRPGEIYLASSSILEASQDVCLGNNYQIRAGVKIPFEKQIRRRTVIISVVLTSDEVRKIESQDPDDNLFFQAAFKFEGDKLFQYTECLNISVLPTTGPTFCSLKRGKE